MLRMNYHNEQRIFPQTGGTRGVRLCVSATVLSVMIHSRSKTDPPDDISELKGLKPDNFCDVLELHSVLCEGLL